MKRVCQRICTPFLCAVMLLLCAVPVEASGSSENFQSEHEAVLYGSGSGLISSEANAIAQTNDGYIWAGTYSGLYRYDGVRFEKFDKDPRLCAIMQLFVDSKGRLWIGTNDAGIACYTPETEEIVFYTMEEGVAADSIRAITEDLRGNIYVGTVSSLSMITPEGEVHTPEKWDSLSGVGSLCCGTDGAVCGVTNSGLLFFLQDGEIAYQRSFGREGFYYTTVTAAKLNSFLVGTSGNQAEWLAFNGQETTRLELVTNNAISYFNRIFYDTETGGVFFCAENGLGLLTSNGTMMNLTRDEFDSSISDVMKDYQGNIWFASSKQGIIEYTADPFIDVFLRAALPNDVVNALLVKDGMIYVATDSGLTILDARTYQEKDFKYLSYFDDNRIRHIMEDSKGQLWISTYGPDGLVRVNADGEAKLFTESSAGTLGGRFRLVLEHSDGTIYAASNMGLNVIRGDEVVSTIGQEEGLESAQILTMVERPDGTVLAGSDGEGIYLIKDAAITGHIGPEEGLDTLVVLRIVPCKDGYIYVTSNALYYDNGQEIKRLTAFPYTNNYDVFLSEDNEAWVMSSAGIYVVDLDELLGNGSYHYELLDYSRGFNTTLTANAWNALLDTEGNLLLCCTDGVRQISTRNYDATDHDYFIRVHSINYGDGTVLPDEKGLYTIPSSAKRIEIQASILNYSLSNPLIHLYLEGANDEGVTVYQNALAPLTYTNLPYGSYTLHIQVLDSTEYTVLRDETFPIYKEPRWTELPVFQVLGIAIVAVLVALIVWRVLQSTIIRRQYAEIRAAKEEAERANTAKSRFLANMSHEIRTPINTIMGMDEMILREDRNEPKSRYTSAVSGYAVSIKRASESLLGLINDILDLSKIESGKMNLVEQEYDTAELLRAIAVMIRVRSNEKDLGFSVEIDPELPKKLFGDDGKIKQVLLNLLTNAVKYTEKGSFALRVSVEKKTEDTATVHYSVKNTGIGIRPEDMEKLFSAFERLDEKRNSAIQGTGLGLDISRQFVELMGDELQCESVYGEGSEFFFTLQQKIIDPEPIGTFVEQEERAESDGPYIPLFAAPEAKILVVDDNEMNLQVLSGLLRPTKVQLTTALSGKECLEKLSDTAYDLVFLDHMMPEMDGIETLQELRKTNETVPVIALTANAAENGEAFYVGKGFQGYLGKPVDARKLEETIRRFLPEEKLCDPTELPQDGDPETVGADPEDILPAWLYETDGLSPSDGVKNCGSPEGFLSALQTFYDTLTEKADEIETAYVSEDWPLYTIKVHALKSAARIIGAEALSKEAERLELAGKADEIETIRKESGTLLLDYRAYREKLSRLSEDDGTDKAEVEPGLLEEAYEALGEFVSAMDYDSTEMVLDSLKAYRLPPEEDARFREMRIRLKQLEWEKLEELLKKK